MCDYELGHLQRVKSLFQHYEKRDPAEILPQTLPDPIAFDSHRDFVREVLHNETGMRAVGTRFIDGDKEQESEATQEYRRHMNSEGSPSDTVASDYHWVPGTEIAQRATQSRR